MDYIESARYFKAIGQDYCLKLPIKTLTIADFFHIIFMNFFILSVKYAHYSTNNNIVISSLARKMQNNKEKISEWRKIGIAFGSSWIVVSSIIISSLIGLGLDWLFHTHKLFLVIMFLFGIVAGMYNLIKELRKME